MSGQTSREDLARLVRAAIDFNASASWSRADDDELIAIENPETGTIGFLATSEVSYDGEPGATVLLDANSVYYFERTADDMSDQTDAMMRQRGIVIGYEPFDGVGDEMRELVTGLDVPIPHDAVPMIYYVEPKSGDGPIEASAARFAAVALEQAIEVLGNSERTPGTFDDAMVAVRVQRDGRWIDEMRPREEVFRLDFGESPLRPEWTARVAGAVRREVEWEYGAMLLPLPLDPERTRALACAHMIAEEGNTLGSTIEEHRDAEGLCELLVETMAHHNVIPRTILVADVELAVALDRLVEELDIVMNVVPALPTIGPAYEERLDALSDDEDLLDEIDDDDDDDDDDEQEGGLVMPSGRQTVTMPESFRYRELVVDYGVSEVLDDEGLDATQTDEIERILEQYGDDLEEYTRQLRGLVERYPQVEALRLELVRVLSDEGEIDEARGLADAALESNPESIAARVAAASMRMELGDFQGALDLFGGARELPDLFPDREYYRAHDLLLFHSVLNVITSELERFAEARDHVRAMNRIAPGNPELELAEQALSNLDGRS